MKHLWLWWSKQDLKIEQQQLIDEGRDISSVQAEFEQLLTSDVAIDESFQQRVAQLFDKARDLPMRNGYSFIEPSDLEGIEQQRATALQPLTLSLANEDIKDRLLGAWLGRCAGCLLGKPIEGIKTHELQPLLDKAGYSEIPDYLWRLPHVSQQDYSDLNLGHILWYSDVKAMPNDDDTNYTVLALSLIKRYGINFTPNDVADFWQDNLAILKTCTAERVAYRNFINNIEPPHSAQVRNPYREWIGAQIRADFFGYVALGKPQLAAELAWRDASISHVKNGIYGAMWVAAMLASAVCESDIPRLIDIGLRYIPQQSRFFIAIKQIIERYTNGCSYETTKHYIHQTWQENNPHHWCHTIANAQIVAMALLYSEGDYTKAITRAVSTCFDTDCNGATVGSIMGMLLGAKALPAQWTEVMNDRIYTDLHGYQDTQISTLAAEMFAMQQALD
jgi:ADP-ribosylglycohydrolase